MRQAVAVKRKSSALVAHQPTEVDKPRFGLGMSSILAQAPKVAGAFGPVLGFILMMTAILAAAGVSVTTITVLAKGIGHFL